MRILLGTLLTAGMSLMAVIALAQPPAGGKKDGPPLGNAGGVDSFVARMMAFDKNKDGKLTKDEITDERLMALFERADANKDGVVTKEELITLFEKESAALGAGGRGGPDGPGGPGSGGPGGPGGRGPGGGGPGGPGGGFPGGPGGVGGRFGPPQPGQVLPAFMQDQLNLSDAQKKQLAELQKTVDAGLEKILTDDQKKQLKEMRNRGPGGRGGPGGGPGGPPPGGPGGPDRQ